MFLATQDGSKAIQSLGWKVHVSEMVYDSSRKGREFQMTEHLIHNHFDQCVTHYRKEGLIKENNVLEFVDMYVAAPESIGSRPQIFQVHVFDNRQAGLML